MSKVALISDIHIGNTINRTDVDIFHNIHLDYAKWLKTQLSANNIQKLIIAGDFFDNRTRIDLKTLDVGHKFLDILQDFEIVVTSGNHDSRRFAGWLGTITLPHHRHLQDYQLTSSSETCQCGSMAAESSKAKRS